MSFNFKKLIFIVSLYFVSFPLFAEDKQILDGAGTAFWDFIITNPKYDIGVILLIGLCWFINKIKS